MGSSPTEVTSTESVQMKRTCTDLKRNRALYCTIYDTLTGLRTIILYHKGYTDWDNGHYMVQNEIYSALQSGVTSLKLNVCGFESHLDDKLRQVAELAKHNFSNR